jgi:DNA-binding NarL/FixJ family response regulator
MDAALSPITVWIVEDNREFLHEFVDIISASGDMRVAGSACTLADGMALLKRDAPPDVVLVDLGLPDGSGLALIREITRRWPGQCNVMVVSVFGDESNVFSALEAGAVGYLLKDSKAPHFLTQIRELHAGGSPISPAIARKLLSRFAPAEAQTESDETETETVQLAPSERDVLSYAARGYSYDEVAQLMGVSRYTVLSYVKRCYRKLQVHSKTQAIYEARRLGIISD